jgi:hypothetical protein
MKILRRLAGHKTTSRTQGPDRYARAGCSCGATFKAPDGRFLLGDFDIWEKTHGRLEPTEGA